MTIHIVDGQGMTPQEFRAYQREKGRRLLAELKQAMESAVVEKPADAQPVAPKSKKRG